MSIILTDAGAVAILGKYFKNVQVANTLALDAATSYQLRLFKSNSTPTDTDTAAGYTPVDANENGSGYAHATLSIANATISVVNNIAQVTYPQINFTFAAPLLANATVYGYYVLDAAGTLIYAERANTSFTPVSPGDAILITPIFQMSKGTPT